MKKSSRLKAPELSSRLEFERVIDNIAATTVRLREREATRDARLQLVRAECEFAVNECVERIKSLTLLAEKFAEEHRAELLPGKLKSGETPLAMFGFRLGNQVLVPSTRGVTWKTVLASLQRLKFRKWIRVKAEPAKDLMLEAAKRSPKAAAALGRIGLTVEQEETFFIEAKDTSSQPARTEPCLHH